jgi:hypothetical protein
VTPPSGVGLLRVISQMPYNGLTGLSFLCVKCKEVETFLNEEFLYGVVVQTALL